jgi:hypothetical protein
VEVSCAGCCCYWIVCLTVEEVGIMLVCMMGLLPAVVVGFVVDLVGFSSSSPPFEEKNII